MTTGNSGGALGSTAIETVEHSTPPHRLPGEPLFTIQPSKSWAALDPRDLWAYRGLLYFLTWRDLKVRYKQTALGAAWVVLQPLLTTLVFTVFLGALVRVPSDGVPYALFVYAGMLPWTFFTGAVTSSSNSLVGSAHLITKVYFPRVLIPVSAVAARLVDFAVASVVLVGLMGYYGTGATWRLVLLAPLLALVTLLALALGMAASALNVRYRDVGVLVPVALQLWMYASPVVYPVSLVPERWQRLYALNPLVGIVGGFRAAVLGQPPDWAALAASTAVTLALVVVATFSFRRMETRFADIV